jgi:hypothetical protein
MVLLVLMALLVPMVLLVLRAHREPLGRMEQMVLMALRVILGHPESTELAVLMEQMVLTA